MKREWFCIRPTCSWRQELIREIACIDDVLTSKVLLPSASVFSVSCSISCQPLFISGGVTASVVVPRTRRSHPLMDEECFFVFFSSGSRITEIRVSIFIGFTFFPYFSVSPHSFSMDAALHAATSPSLRIPRLSHFCTRNSGRLECVTA